MNSYVSYMGGKASSNDTLVGSMPPEAKITYMEPCCGGANTFFAKDKAHVNVLNDADEDIVVMHQTVSVESDRVTEELQRLPVSRLIYEEIRATRETAQWHDLTPVQRAARMIYLLSIAFNANPRAPFPASPVTPLRFRPDKDLRPFAEKLSGVTFECLDWSIFLDRYVMNQKKLRCLLNLDPPYVVTATAAHYRHRFSQLDHVQLAHKLALVNEGNGGDRSVKVMLTYDDDPDGLIRALYRKDFGWNIRTFPVRYSSGRHATATDELLITNYVIGGES